MILIRTIWIKWCLLELRLLLCWSWQKVIIQSRTSTFCILFYLNEEANYISFDFIHTDQIFLKLKTNRRLPIPVCFRLTGVNNRVPAIIGKNSPTTNRRMDICDPLLSPKTKLNNAKGTLISTRNQQIYLFCDVVWSLTPILQCVNVFPYGCPSSVEHCL